MVGGDFSSKLGHPDPRHLRELVQLLIKSLEIQTEKNKYVVLLNSAF